MAYYPNSGTGPGNPRVVVPPEPSETEKRILAAAQRCRERTEWTPHGWKIYLNGKQILRGPNYQLGTLAWKAAQIANGEDNGEIELDPFYPYVVHGVEPLRESF